jgi:ribosome-associated toxin RatA of RatAB toxin-antitoxin module
MEAGVGAAERKESVNVSLEALYGVITDYASYPEFVTGMKKARVLEEGPAGKRVVFDLEMMKRIEYTVRMNESKSDDGQTAQVEWTLESSDFMKKNNGRWSLKKTGPEQSEVVYSLEVEFKFPVPGFVLKGLVSNSLPSAIREFTERAKKLGAKL